MTSQLYFLIALDFGIQFVGWLISAIFHTERFFDLTGSLSFILLTYLSRRASRGTLRQNIQSSCVLIWAVRLGLFLFYRISKSGTDSRFDEMRHSPGKLLGVWFMQGIWVMVMLLPTLFLNEKQRDKPLTGADYLGWSIWLFGFVVEVLADSQKMAFRSDPNNKEKFIDTGLWRYSRHPNYFGEICQWLGLYISSSHMLTSSESLLGILSPIFITLLLSFVSGIPMLEKQAMKRFGHNPAYRTYRSETPVLVPFVNFPRI